MVQYSGRFALKNEKQKYRSTRVCKKLIYPNPIYKKNIAEKLGRVPFPVNKLFLPVWNGEVNQI